MRANHNENDARLSNANRPLPIVILGDDLTGCCDAAAAFAHGPSRVVFLSEDSALDVPPTGTLSICTASRQQAPQVAASRIRSAITRLGSPSSCHWFKKIDSTLKGNVAEEVTACLEASIATIAVLTPAFPQQGRVVRNGNLETRGMSRSLALPDLLRRGSKLPVRHFSIAGLAALCDQSTFDRSAGTEAQIWTFDALCAEDVARVAQLVRILGPRALPVGSAGLAYALAPYFSGVCPSTKTNCFPSAVAGRLIVLAGSVNPLTSQQVQRLQDLRCGILLEEDPLVAQFAEGESHTPLTIRWKWNARTRDAIEGVLQRLAGTPGTILLTGGDTAQAFVEMTGVHALEIRGDVATGIPWGTICGGLLDGWQFVTKAGGFGTPDLLVELYDRCVMTG